MKLKLTVGNLGSGDTDVLLIADVTATIGDVARTLILNQPGETSPLAEGAKANTMPLTLRVRYPDNPTFYVLDPLATMIDSGLQSGCWVSAIPTNPVVAGDVLLYQRAAIATIESGPQKNVEFVLAPGENLIGRSGGCRVQLTDSKVSRKHARIDIGTTMHITDLNSGNGVYVEGTRVTSDTIQPYDRITVGDTNFSIRFADSSLSQHDSPPPTVIDFTRSPRVEVRYLNKKIAAPVPPQAAQPQKFPFIAMIAPLLMGVVLYAATQNPLSLVFVALSPVMMLGTYIDGVVTGRRQTRAGNQRFDAALNDLQTKLETEREKETLARNIESPATHEVYEAAVSKTPLLWARRPEHQTFLEVRLGFGTQASRITLDLPTRSDALEEFWNRLDDVNEANRSVSGVPVLEKFERAGNIGVTGAPGWSEGVLRSLILQLCGLHSPADLVIACFASAAGRDEWGWLKWLPHVGSVHSPITMSHLAADTAPNAQLLAQLEELLAHRKALGATASAGIRSHLDPENTIDDLHGREVRALPVTPAIVVIVTSGTEVDASRLVSIAEEGPDFGIHLLWHADSVAALPAACRTYIDVCADGTGEVGFVRSSARVAISPLEVLGGPEAIVAAKALSSVRDSGARVLDESDLPTSVAFQDLQTADVTASPKAVRERWTVNHSVTSLWNADRPTEASGLSAIVGQGTADVLKLDLREHGPHALVGGTTGSGKSEFLQTWIMSLASEYSPDRVTFLLVDYKGGAAFAECTKLPHTVGLVTDLNPHLVRRALTSLRAELHYRENLLNEKAAKDLITLEKRGDQDAPPSLIIVIDEFAALVGEVPEFVDGVIDVAQRGRSLGLHLVMATQRPAGVIKDSLRANTNLRIALRVADEADSQDVIGRKDAAGFDPSTPGRAAAKLGPGKLIHFQAAYLGGRRSTAPATSDIEIVEFPFDLTESWVSPLAPPPPRKDAPRDIESMLDSIQRAATALRLATPRKPWLDQLEPVIDFASLPASHQTGIVVGVQDEPEAQRQSAFSFEPESEGNLAIYGTSGSGKSAAIRTLLLSASRNAPADPVHIYALDFAGGALGMLENLPTVGAVINGDDTERVQRLIRQLTDLATDRSQRYSRVRASTLSDYRTNTGTTTEPRIIVAIDGMANFKNTYEFRHGDDTFVALSQLLAVGRQVGMHFIFSADRPGVIPTVMTANIQQRIVLRMAAEADYGILGVPSGVLNDAPAGRGVVDGRELQLAIMGGSGSLLDQAAGVDQLAATLAQSGVPQTPPIERLAESIPLSSLPALADGLPVIGVADATLMPIGVAPEGLIVITGPFGSGKTTALSTIVTSITRSGENVDAVLISPRASSELEAVCTWTSVALGATDAEVTARDMATTLRDAPGSWPKKGKTGLIVIESAGDFEGSTAEGVVASLIKAGRKSNALIVVELDLTTGPAAWQIYSELKTARAGIVLQPDEGDAIGLFRVALPRGGRADYPTGRGYLIESGRATQLQIATPD